VGNIDADGEGGLGDGPWHRARTAVDPARLGEHENHAAVALGHSVVVRCGVDEQPSEAAEHLDLLEVAILIIHDASLPKRRIGRRREGK